jgi:hypothetical protein
MTSACLSPSQAPEDRLRRVSTNCPSSQQRKSWIPAFAGMTGRVAAMGRSFGRLVGNSEDIGESAGATPILTSISGKIHSL